jgi:hypothetical protein
MSGITAMVLPVAPKLRRLIPLLGSDKPGEVLGTVEAMKRILAGAGLDLFDLAKALGDPPAYVSGPAPTNWHSLVALCLAQPTALRDQDITFLHSMRRQLLAGRTPSEKQAEWLRSCWTRVDAAGGMQ